MIIIDFAPAENAYVIEVRGDPMTISAEIALAISVEYTKIYSEDPKLAYKFREVLRTIIMDDASTLWEAK